MRLHPLVDLITAPWAIVPEKLREIQAIYASHVAGKDIDIAAVEARLGRPLASEQQTYQVDAHGVATLEVNGVMAPKANLFMQVSGGTSTQMLTSQLNSMRADARVRSAVIVWDSPGGNVQGVPAAAAALKALSADKPVVSLARGIMASAAYWVGSAANAVYIEGATDLLGSIGVYQRLSWQDPEPNTLELVRGKYKRLALNGKGPSAEVVAEAEAQLDYLYTVLVDAVAAHRGVSADVVLDRMADGRLFTGGLAIDAGLADGVATLEELQARLVEQPSAFAARRKARMSAAASADDLNLASGSAASPTGEPPMSKILLASALAMAAAEFAAALAEEKPDFVAALENQGAERGATAERQRIQSVLAQSLPGHEALIQTLAFDGHTTGPEAAVAVLQAERNLAARQRQALADDTPPPLNAGASATGEPPAKTPTDDDKPASPMQRAQALGDAIAVKQAEAKAAGRTLSASDALALVKKEQSNG